MNCLSLFSGIGGFDIAMEALGVEVVHQVEIDEYCNKVLERHWPNVPRDKDIRTTDFTRFRGIDAICAGFPCQPFSVAGKNRGEADDRNMWPDTYRAICEARPGFVMLENVPNLLTHEYFGRILADLSQTGYDAEWGTFRASDVGAPHKRERLFILGYSKCEPLANAERGRPRRRSDSAQGRNESRKDAGVSTARSVGELDNAASSRFAGYERALGGQQENAESYMASIWPPNPDDYEGWTRLLAEMPEIEPAICRDATRIPDRTHRLKALGNAIVPQQAVLAFCELINRMKT